MRPTNTDRHICPARLWPHCPKCDAGRSVEESMRDSARQRIEWAAAGHDYDDPTDDWHLL